MGNEIKTIQGEELISQLKKKLKGKQWITAEMGDTLVIKEVKESFESWTSPIQKIAREEGITEEEIDRIIQEVRGRA